jgi:hypothetical protein
MLNIFIFYLRIFELEQNINNLDVRKILRKFFKPMGIFPYI